MSQPSDPQALHAALVAEIKRRIKRADKQLPSFNGECFSCRCGKSASGAGEWVLQIAEAHDCVYTEHPAALRQLLEIAERHAPEDEERSAYPGVAWCSHCGNEWKGVHWPCADLLNVEKAVIGRIRRGQAWTHISGLIYMQGESRADYLSVERAMGGDAK